MKNQLFKRFKKNPILTKKDVPYLANSILNPGAVEFNHQTLLLCRIEDKRGFSHFGKALSKNGKTGWALGEQPAFLPNPKKYPEELWGIEDARITYLEELKKYAVCYTAYSRRGPLVALALTDDFENFERKGAIMLPENKDAALFPCRFNGSWLILHRPAPARTSQGAHIWISSSPDLIHWGRHKVLLEARGGGWWDSSKIGLGPQPIKTKAGWLIIYHGVRLTAAGNIYRLGLALLDLDNPAKVICRSDQWVLAPETEYEILGEVENVIFTCGAVYNQKTKKLKLYYGASDSTIALATAKMEEVLEFLQEGRKSKVIYE